MNRLRMFVPMALMVPAWGLLGGFARLDVPGPGGVVEGMILGGAIGVFFGLVFGGAKGKWLDPVFGPELSEEGAPTRKNTSVEGVAPRRRRAGSPNERSNVP